MHLAPAIAPQVPSAGFQKMVGLCSAAVWQLMCQQITGSDKLNLQWKANQELDLGLAVMYAKCAGYLQAAWHSTVQKA